MKEIQTNLKFNELYSIIYKGNPLSIEEEKKINLDELYYKELKVFFSKLKDYKNFISNKVHKTE